MGGAFASASASAAGPAAPRSWSRSRVEAEIGAPEEPEPPPPPEDPPPPEGELLFSWLPHAPGIDWAYWSISEPLGTFKPAPQPGFAVATAGTTLSNRA